MLENLEPVRAQHLILWFALVSTAAERYYTPAPGILPGGKPGPADTAKLAPIHRVSARGVQFQFETLRLMLRHYDYGPEATIKSPPLNYRSTSVPHMECSSERGRRRNLQA